MTTHRKKPALVIIGASSAIARAVIDEVLASAQYQVIAISRVIPAYQSNLADVQYFTCDYSEQGIADVCSRVVDLQLDIDRIIITNGILHDDIAFPEKRIGELSVQKLMHSYHVNAVIPILWLQHLIKMLPKSSRCVVVVFSARVGSIEDNKIGGWYSYRASKAGLNMMLMSAQREVKRSLPNMDLFVFHPGTTDTPMSKPFQANVPKEKLFTPEFVAQRLMSIMADSPKSDRLLFLDWDRKTIPW